MNILTNFFCFARCLFQVFVCQCVSKSIMQEVTIFAYLWLATTTLCGNAQHLWLVTTTLCGNAQHLWLVTTTLCGNAQHLWLVTTTLCGNAQHQISAKVFLRNILVFSWSIFLRDFKLFLKFSPRANKLLFWETIFVFQLNTMVSIIIYLKFCKKYHSKNS